MDIDFKPRTKTITLPDIDSHDVFNALLIKREEILSEIDKAISRLAKNDDAEISRINRAFWWPMYNHFIGKKPDLEIEKPKDKEPSVPEATLSMAIYILDTIPDAIESGKLKEVFFALCAASEMLGMAWGITADENKTSIERHKLYQEAAFKRHEGNYKMQADAMKYYAENIDKFQSKDAAAEAIAGKIVTASFRTVRKWITEYHKNIRSASTA